ncbi:winged helix-turn-helix domain-containing protein [Streptomyces netropsis]|uniref:winged helix-turn-helix domain-containing protein n=1 Tax=Streptomyces netropsis TaxID=55404 RepID=UPI0037B05483
MIGRGFRISLSVHSVWELLRRNGWSCQMPARRATERDEQAVVGWVKETWSHVETPRRRSAPGSSSKTRPGSR